VTADSDRQSGAGPRTADDALRNVLTHLAEEGYVDDLVPAGEGGVLRCTRCGESSPAGAFRVERERRLEGASDPDDMVLVVAARCPACGAAGTVVLGYGPEASGADSDLVVALPRSEG
jgi:hypothetical protein